MAFSLSKLPYQKCTSGAETDREQRSSARAKLLQKGWVVLPCKGSRQINLTLKLGVDLGASNLYVIERAHSAKMTEETCAPHSITGAQESCVRIKVFGPRRESLIREDVSKALDLSGEI